MGGGVTSVFVLICQLPSCRILILPDLKVHSNNDVPRCTVGHHFSQKISIKEDILNDFRGNPEKKYLPIFIDHYKNIEFISTCECVDFHSCLISDQRLLFDLQVLVGSHTKQALLWPRHRKLRRYSESDLTTPDGNTDDYYKYFNYILKRPIIPKLKLKVHKKGLVIRALRNISSLVTLVFDWEFWFQQTNSCSMVKAINKPKFFLGIKYNLKVYIRGTLSTAYHNCLGRVHDHSLINSKFCNFNYNRCDIEKSNTFVLTARVAQWIRRRSPKPKIGGSSPPVGRNTFCILNL